MTPRWHPFDIVLRVLAERLDGCQPSHDLRAVLGSQGIDWAGVVGQASGQYVLAALAAALRDLDLAGALDPDLRDFLAAVYAANVERNHKLQDQLVELVAPLNRIGVEPVLLKGAIRLVDGLYPEIGWRMMRDLDVLVSEGSLAEAVEVLRGIGYDSEQRAIDPLEKDWRARHPDRPALVEVHRELFGAARQRRLLPAADVINGARPATFHGTRVRLPALEHQIVHLIGHGQLLEGGYASGRIELRDRLEAGLLVRSSPRGVDWDRLFARFAAAGYYRPLASFLLALNDDALCAAPIRGRIDGLVRFQRRRVALQARSVAMTLAGWYFLRVKKQASKGAKGWPRVVQTCRELFKDHGARRALIKKIIRGPQLQSLMLLLIGTYA